MMENANQKNIPVPQLSMITQRLTDIILQQWAHLLTTMNQNWLSPQNLENYAQAINHKGSPLTNCWGFIDGTVRPVSKPGMYQRVLYNGHKRVHALKFQSVVAANGLIANLYGPVEGRRHDSGMLVDSFLVGPGHWQYHIVPCGVLD